MTVLTFDEDEGDDHPVVPLSDLGVVSTVTVSGLTEIQFSFTASGYSFLTPTTTTTTTSISTPPPQTETWTSPPSPSCSVSSSATQVVITATENFSIPSRVPKLIVAVPFADGQGSWGLTIGGPSRQSDISDVDVLVNGALRASATDASQFFQWTSDSGDTGTTLEFDLNANLGIEIFDMTLVGTVSDL